MIAARRSRRTVAVVVMCAAVLLAACSGSGSSHHSSRARESDAALATEAYVWGYPLVVTERTLQSLARLAPVNRLTFQAARSSLSTRTVVAPNTDTLYAVVPLDLRGEPYVLTLPAITDRHYVFQFLSAYTDSFAYVGTRATGPDGFFTANPIDRYAIGDRTAGMQYGTDRSLDVYVQHAPAPGHQAKWLPAPAGPFYLSMRLYLPEHAVLDGTYRYPRVTRVR